MALRRGLGKGEQPVRGEFLDDVAANIEARGAKLLLFARAEARRPRLDTL